MTGKAKKFDSDKPRLSHLPPWVIIDLMAVMEYGAGKYGTHNYLAGDMQDSRLYDAAIRHILAHESGIFCDDESLSPHLLHAAASLLMLYACYITDNINDDRMVLK
jgi:hypothetical protein